MTSDAVDVARVTRVDRTSSRSLHVAAAIVVGNGPAGHNALGRWRHDERHPYTATMLRRLPLVFDPQPEGGFTVTSPVLPDLIIECDTLEQAYADVADALTAVVELYFKQGRPLPTPA